MFNISSNQLVIYELNVLKHVTSRHAEAAYPKTTPRQTQTVSPIEKPGSESQKGKKLCISTTLQNTSWCKLIPTESELNLPSS